MDSMKYLRSLREGIIALDFAAVTKAAKEAMESGVDPNVAISEGMVPGMVIVGEKFEKGDYFLSELVVATEVMKEGMNVITPYLKGQTLKKLGTAVMATVEGDLHDLGKNMVAALLRVHGFEVVDLGIDVPPSRIIEAVKEHQPAIVGMSALLTVTMPKMGEVIDALKSENLRDKVKVIVGGSPVTDEYSRKIGADHRGVNAAEGVKKCVEWITARERRA